MVGNDLLERDDGLIHFGDRASYPHTYGYHKGGILSLGELWRWHPADWESTPSQINRTLTELSQDAVSLLEKAAAGPLELYVYRPLETPREQVRYIDMGFIAAECGDHVVVPERTDRFVLLTNGPVAEEVATVLAEGIRAEAGLDPLDANMLPMYALDAFLAGQDASA